MRARLSDIAQQAQVSEATVSRVLNDRPGVSPETRQAVLTALDVLGYERPARLRKRSSWSTGSPRMSRPPSSPATTGLPANSPSRTWSPWVTAGSG
jgi:hypothetical protein